MSATALGSYWKMFEPRVPGFIHIQTCYPFRFHGASPGETAGQAAARELEEAILREGPDTVAAFIGEPIHGAGGVIYPTDDYWPRIREICTRHDVLLISDEVIDLMIPVLFYWIRRRRWMKQRAVASIEGQLVKSFA